MENKLLLSILIEESESITSAKQIDALSRKYKNALANDNANFLELCEELIKTGKSNLFTLTTIWLKQKQLYDKSYFAMYERWLFTYVDQWSKCDVFCYRVLNPMIEMYPDLLKRSKSWKDAELVYVRRASAVCMIHSSIEFSVNVPFEDVEEVCTALLHDKHLHVQKGIGWLLKYAYITYPEKTILYLQQHVRDMSRTTFRYALEKMPIQLKKELMTL